MCWLEECQCHSQLLLQWRWQHGTAGAASGCRHCTGWPEPPRTGRSTDGFGSPNPLQCSRPVCWLQSSSSGKKR